MVPETFRTFEDCFRAIRNILNCPKLLQNLSEATSGMLNVCFMALPNIQDFPIIVSVVPETFRTFEDCFRAIRNILKLSEVSSELSEATSGMLNVCFRDSEILLNCPKQYQRLAMFVSLIFETFKIFEDCFRVFRITSELSKVVLEPFRSNIRDARYLFQGFTKHSGLPDNCFSGSWNIQNFWRLFQGYSKHFKTVLSCFIIVRSNIRDARCLFQGITKHSGLPDNCFSGSWNIQNFWRLFQSYSKHFKTVRCCFRIVRINFRDAQCLFSGNYETFRTSR